MFSFSEVEDLSEKYQVIPLVKKLFSGTESPVSLFEKLAAGNPGSFLLESAEQGVWSRFSFIGVDSVALLSSSDGRTEIVSDSGFAIPGLSSDALNLDSLSALSILQQGFRSYNDPDLPPLVSGMVGFMGWDTVHELEKLGVRKQKDYPLPDLAMSVIRDLVVVDHSDSSLLLISNIYLADSSSLEALYLEAINRINKMKTLITKPTAPFVAEQLEGQDPPVEFRTPKPEFLNSVEAAKERVRAGDVFQVVISQRFDVHCQASAIDVYRTLRALNPSPYMYLLNLEDKSGPYFVVGSSPEALVRVSGDRAVLHPIAGSRPRGTTQESDLKLAEELSTDQKEKAEHLMLVDLARNDLLKVCRPESVTVTEFMQVERYSHVMHLVSTVEGELATGKTPIDVLRATFPAGTLSGAPKPKALEIIEQLEPSNRGLFGGVVGYLDFAGNADLAIAIRTAVIRDGRAYVQAGAGIVLDSDAELEYQETVNKASAPLKAIVRANTLRRISN